MSELLQPRPVEPPDVDELIVMCAEHAAYERAPFTDDGQRERLAAALFGPSPALLCWVAGEPHALQGYATATLEFATWTARRFLHMDCLFVRAAVRGRCLGQKLFEAVRDTALSLGVDAMQWQTPQWNTGAQRFYERRGASAVQKQRYTLLLAPATAAALPPAHADCS
jgi:GNAT superfamily N-acetyltransferase